MSYTYAAYKRPTSEQKIHTDWKWRDGKRYSMRQQQKNAGVVIFISEKIDFKTKAITRDKWGHYIILKVSIQQENITLINIRAPNLGAPKNA